MQIIKHKFLKKEEKISQLGIIYKNEKNSPYDSAHKSRFNKPKLFERKFWMHCKS